MSKINKVMAESFKKVFEAITEEAKQKVVEMGYDPNSIKGKSLVYSFQKKVLFKMGINLEDHDNEDFLMLWEENKDEIMKEIRKELENVSEDVKDLSGYLDAFDKRMEDMERKKINWDEIMNRPGDVSFFNHTDQDHKKTISDIQLLFKNIISTRESLKEEFDRKINGLTVRHKDLIGIGPDDHHKEKHTLESHLDSELMTKIIDFIKNPYSGKPYMHGGGASYFINLLDAPTSYTGQASKSLKVKSDESGLEFSADIGGTWNEEYGSGTVNGVNKSFTFAHTPAFVSLEGQALSILNGDYTVVGNVITLANAPTLNPPINKFLS